MDKTPSEMIRILPDHEFSLANDFVLLGEKLNCKRKVRFATAHKTWKCVYERKKLEGNYVRMKKRIRCS